MKGVCSMNPQMYLLIWWILLGHGTVSAVVVVGGYNKRPESTQTIKHGIINQIHTNYGGGGRDSPIVSTDKPQQNSPSSSCRLMQIGSLNRLVLQTRLLADGYCAEERMDRWMDEILPSYRY